MSERVRYKIYRPGWKKEKLTKGHCSGVSTATEMWAKNTCMRGPVARIIKKYALLAGLEPEKYSAHSLRRGGITNALMNGVSIEVASGWSNHNDINVFMGYVDEARRFQVNITAMMGL